MPKLQAKISQQLHDVIVYAKSDLDLKKEKVLQRFISLALRNPNSDKRDFGSSEDKSCTLEFSKANWGETQDYRQLHSIDTKVGFFRDALARGASIYLSQKDGDPEDDDGTHDPGPSVSG